MKILLNTTALLLAGLMLASCSDSKDSVETMEQGKESASAPAKANNPLASEQQLIKDAKGIQDILNKDAEEKKKAVSDSN